MERRNEFKSSMIMCFATRRKRRVVRDERRAIERSDDRFDGAGERTVGFEKEKGKERRRQK